MRPLVELCYRDGAGRTLELKACPFEVSPDEDFIIDRDPESDRVVFAAGVSVRGFTFSVIGEILADLAVEGETSHHIGRFRIDRFA